MSVNNKAEQIKELLGTGLSVEVVSSAAGCTPSYVSQLMSEETFANEVASLRSVALRAANERDKSIDGIEDKLIARLAGLADETHTFLKPRDLLVAFQIVNRAQRRGISAQQSAIVTQTVVALNIPVKVVNKFSVSSQGEVVSVGEQTLVTMPTSTLLGKLRSGEIKGGSIGEKYSDAAKFLAVGAVSNHRQLVIEGASEAAD